MTMQASETVPDAELATRLLQRLAEDLGMLLGHDVAIGAPAVARATARPAGHGQVHVSFKLLFTRASGPTLAGALLVPLPEASTMAALLQLLPEELVPGVRERRELDAAQKEALLELGTMITDSWKSALAQLGLTGWTLRPGGCQGVRADVRPALPYTEGSPLIVARAPASIGTYPPFELLLMLPPLSGAA